MLAKYKNIIIALVVIIVAFVVYSMFFKPDPDGDLLTTTGSLDPQSSNEALGADIVRAINQISALELDRSVFQHPVLLRLVDRSEVINPQPVGRNNPFAPLGVISQPAGDLIVGDADDEQDSE